MPGLFVSADIKGKMKPVASGYKLFHIELSLGITP